jgi:glycosyltransferase involved in cell wall biosynthesis
MRYSNAQFLLVTHTPKEFVTKEIFARNLSLDSFIIKEASRQQVPLLLKASDINVSFIKPVYSKMSSSPTKLGEVLAMGIPVITNEGVGDVKEILEKIGGGLVLNFNSINWKEVVATIPQLLTFNENAISQKTNEILSLSLAIKKYLNVYKKI